MLACMTSIPKVVLGCERRYLESKAGIFVLHPHYFLKVGALDKHVGSLGILNCVSFCGSIVVFICSRSIFSLSLPRAGALTVLSYRLQFIGEAWAVPGSLAENLEMEGDFWLSPSSSTNVMVRFYAHSRLGDTAQKQQSWIIPC